MRRPRFGAALNYVPDLIVKPDWNGLKYVAIECEKLQYDSIWIMDHFTYHGLPAVMECYSTLGALAAVTSKIRIGSLVSCNSYRHPPLVAKMISTLDLISNGRINFGIGAGWKEDESAMYGYEFPAARTRIEQLRESVQIIRSMWTKPGASFHGKYYRIDGMQFGPELIQKPHPPIWIGGKGPNMLKVVAELGDYSNMVAGQFVSIEDYHQKMTRLKDHCKVIKRDYDEITKSLGLDVIIGKTQEEVRRKLKHAYENEYYDPAIKSPRRVSIEEYAKGKLVGTPDQCVSQLNSWLSEDVDYVLVGWTMNVDDWSLFAEKVIPAFS